MDGPYCLKGNKVITEPAPPPPHNPLRRPAVRIMPALWRLALFVAVLFLVQHVSTLLLSNCKYGVACSWIVTSSLFFIVVSLNSKRAAIWGVHLYQRYAPKRIRLKCLFEPSCSEYMIASIEKHGTICGIIRGLKRISRCHPPNGGVDLP